MRGKWPGRSRPACGVLASALAACQPIEGTPRTTAPFNECPAFACSLFPPNQRGAPAMCRDGQCELGTRPDSSSFTLVVNVPETSFFGAGQAFAATNQEIYGPRVDPIGSCSAPTCLPLRALVSSQGTYILKPDAAAALGLVATSDFSVPLDVTFVHANDPNSELPLAELPLGSLSASSVRTPTGILYDRVLPSGSYTRYAYPQPPWDAWIPPIVGPFTVGVVDFPEPFDATKLDDPTGDARRANISRAEGLDGFRLWLADSTTGRRISVVRTLRGDRDQAVLHTIGQSKVPGTALRDNVDVLLVPPDTSVALPRLQGRLVGGQGFGTLDYPSLPPPGTLRGVVVSESGGSAPGGLRSQVTLRSQSIAVVGSSDQVVLRYQRSVFTDGAGVFSALVPAGTYDVVVDPNVGNGYGKVAAVVQVPGAALRVVPPRLLDVMGRALVGDGRPLAEAEVLAVALQGEVVDAQGRPEPLLVPRSAISTTEVDGTFHLDLEPGRYDISVKPKDGTGFPRVVSRVDVGVDATDVGTIRVGAPTRVSIAIKDPRAQNPIALAVVQAFVLPQDGGPPIQLGSAMTDSQGQCELLLPDPLP